MYGSMKSLRTATITSDNELQLGEKLENWFSTVGESYEVLDIKYSTVNIDPTDKSYDGVREYALIIYRYKEEGK